MMIIWATSSADHEARERWARDAMLVYRVAGCSKKHIEIELHRSFWARARRVYSS